MRDLSLTEKLEKWVAEGGRVIGEVVIVADSGRYKLSHRADQGAASGLESFSGPSAARDLVRYDDGGAYRPLKSAPGLKRGWVLDLDDAEDLREALDYFYPAAIGIWFANQEGALEAVPLREVLGRQTGMYRFANNLSDAGAQTLVGRACGAAGGCLRRVCWGLEKDRPIESLPAGELSREPGEPGEMPILCVEACNLLVAAARQASADEFEAAQEDGSGAS
ncbi:MAG: DR2241 family protein [Verrucomicrobiales bacterium]